MAKLTKKMRARIDALELPETWMVFFHNIKGIDFYDGELGSPDRVARNVNTIAFFNSQADINRFYTTAMMSNICSEDGGEQLTIEQRLYHNLVQHIHDTLVNDINMDELLKDVEDDPDGTFRKILSKLPNYDNLKNEVFDVMKDHKDSDYDCYGDLTHFPYTKDQCKLLLYAFTQMNTLFSLYAVAMNSDKEADLYIVKLKDTELLRIWELYMADFQGQMNEEANAADFPMYQKWCQYEIDFFKTIDKRKIPWGEYIHDNVQNAKVDLDVLSGNMDSLFKIGTSPESKIETD